MTNSLCKCGTISIEGLMKLTLLLLLRTRSPTDAGRKPILQHNLYTNRQRQTGIRNSQVCEIVTSLLPL